MNVNVQTEPWKEFPYIWSTKSKFMSWVRGGIRGGLWKKHPVKLQYMESKTFKIENTNPRSMKAHPLVKASQCEICGVVEKLVVNKKNYFEVDHINGNSSLRSMDDVRSFIDSMIMVTFDDLQIVCKECHAVKTLAERKGVSFEEAFLEKQVIAVCKGSTSSVKAFLIERGMEPAGNAEQRKKQVREALKTGGSN